VCELIAGIVEHASEISERARDRMAGSSGDP